MSATEEWDQPDDLRGELLPADLLEGHAAHLAETQGKPSKTVRQGALRARFTTARSRINDAYVILARSAPKRRDLSLAEEWLLDNSHVVEDQLREIEEDLPGGYLVQLPRIAKGVMAGFPCVYGLCLDYLRHTDARIDLDTLTRYVVGYQTVRTLTIGELWAVPIMLRLGLVLRVSALATSEANSHDRARGDEWAEKIFSADHSPHMVPKTIAALAGESTVHTPQFLVHLLRRLREHDASSGVAFDWIREQSLKLGLAPEELARREHFRQAADQVSVGNAITSMRTIAAMDWNRFFEGTSSVEAILRQDPAAAYETTDKASRDRYRHAIEDTARRSNGDECDVAERAVALANEAPLDHAARRHVGYYLIGHGRRVLEAQVHYRPRFKERVQRLALNWPSAFYLGAMSIIALGIVALMLDAAYRSGVVSPVLLGALALLAILPATDLGMTFVNSVVTSLLPPKLLAKLDFSEGIPKEFTTLVVVPALLDSEAGIRRLLGELEIRSLANGDDNLYFALITDYTDNNEEHAANDETLLAIAREGIAELNRRQRADHPHRFSLFHRRRLYNEAQNAWMGWERKRGKLEELNLLLRGKSDTTFTDVTLPAKLFPIIRYVITLDADTELPREVARKLVAAMAHPLNHARIDPRTGRVSEGYGVIQPAVGIEPVSARRSLYARIMAGQAGIDPYTTASSDVYQDLFEEGSYVGKAIYDLDAFTSALHDRVPDNRMLSHDLFEGLMARCALATDIELLDDQPASYSVVAGRQHRWIRGDWQLVEWLWFNIPHRKDARRSNDLPLIARWKLFDNLRRSLVPCASIALLLTGWIFGGATAAIATSVVLAVLALPVLGRLVMAVTRPTTESSPSFMSVLRTDIGINSLRALLNLVFLLDQAFITGDAVLRTLHRLVISKKNLLEWTTTSEVERRAAKSGPQLERRLVWGAALSIATLIALIAIRSTALPWAAPIVLGFSVAPWLAQWLSKPLPSRDRDLALSETERQELRFCARKTWHFFETFVTAEDNWLPPDNYQEDPRGVVAHRTSPTNMGLYLMSTIAARDFAYITLGEMTERLSATLATLAKIDKRSGHILNWYDTTTLRPLDPQYVSTVDSGNLAGYLWTIREACSELWNAPLVGASLIDGAVDALLLSTRDPSGTEHERTSVNSELDLAIAEAKARLHDDSANPLPVLRKLSAEGRRLFTGENRSEDSAMWLEKAHRQLDGAIDELGTLTGFHALVEDPPAALLVDGLAAPWAELRRSLSRASTLRSVVDAAPPAETRIDDLIEACSSIKDIAMRTTTLEFLERLRQKLTAANDAATKLGRELDRLGAASGTLADEMSFGFLYNRERALFSIGYNIGGARLDPSHYDLLASEARLASMVAIAKGDVPQEHWFRLGRPRSGLDTGAVLLSWSGSMFEYLMPLLVTKRYESTLLDETYSSMVKRQEAYGEERSVPWGVSESAYNMMDLSMTYQYRAFGVPGLGMKAGLANDLVIAPYATVLAALIDPKGAVKNLRRLTKDGLEGPYGYYEAIDYTPAHVPPGRQGVVVKAYMAHHQGMSLVALDNLLMGFPMQRRFHAHPPIKASELLLEERVPLATPHVELRMTGPSPIASGNDSELNFVEHVGLGAKGPLRAHLIGHGELSTLVTALGTGITTWKGMDVHRFREDPAAPPHGIFVYLRDTAIDQVWSAGFEPTRRAPDEYDAAFSPDKVEIHRKDADIETVMEVGVSPEHPAEVRRITLTNHGSAPRTIELTTYTEVVLAPRNADVAHRAFSNMFVETEAVTDRSALMARRKKRAPNDPETWMVQTMATEGGEVGAFQFDTSRSEFIGRGRTTESPQALDRGSKLGGRVGAVLDPALIMRRSVTVGPGKHVRITISTALAASREGALELVDTYTDASSGTRTFELGWADARVELKHLGMTGAQADRSQKLLSAILFPQPELRYRPAVGEVHGRSRSVLWGLGISGDLPLLVLRIDDPDFSDICRELLLAHELWRLNGITVDFLILNEEPSGYNQPLQEGALSLVRSSPAVSRIDQSGGVFIRKADQLSPSDRTLVLASARVVLLASSGSVGRQLRAAVTDAKPMGEAVVHRKQTKAVSPDVMPDPELTFANGIGGFSSDGHEYVMRISSKKRAPAPWCNVIANESFGTVVSESGSAFTWSTNSQSHRLTAWSNDVVSDPSGQVIYVRDEEDGSSWSTTPLPRGGDALYEVRHGQGFSVFSHTRSELAQELTIFVDKTDPVQLARLRIENKSHRARKLSVVGYVEWVLGGTREKSRLTILTDAQNQKAVTAFNPASGFPDRRAFFGATKSGTFTGDRAEFIGRHGSRAKPAGLERSVMSNRTGAGLDPCAALMIPVTIEAGETLSLTFVLGEGENADKARDLLTRYTEESAVDPALKAAREYWDSLLGTITVKTPDSSLDLMANRWLLYQVLSARIWARSAFYQSGGAYGFRDQLQDSLALCHAQPKVAREQILRSAARQFREGDVQHWWHPETGEGVRTHCSDDMLWLPYVTAEYVKATGDNALLDEMVPFLIQAELEPGQDDHFGVPASTQESFSIYEHCVRALDRGTTAGKHGLPLMKGGDWNDGMNRIGAGDQGESIWLAWFLVKTLRDFAPLADARGDHPRKDRCLEGVTRVIHAIDFESWDGQWYLRAYFDDGTPVGSSGSAECRIDAIAQSWAAIAGGGDASRARMAIDRSEEMLFDRNESMMKLFTPPFVSSDPSPGYIQGYPAGVRENGGQYTHGVLWTVLALTALGEGERAHTLLEHLNPIHHTKTPEAIQHYGIEPYVVAADVYAAEGFVGHGGWSWYTGSAAWMYRITIEHVLGIRLVEGRVAFVPCIPPTWKSYEVDYRGPDGSLHIVVENPNGLSHGMTTVTVDGKPAPQGLVDLPNDGKTHQVRVVLSKERAQPEASRASAPAA